ncbi:MAG: DedA family protein [Flavobacteriales bacterium]|nr:DedA family protein [Flavobacteriales bacterium]
MDIIKGFLDFVLHFDIFLKDWIVTYDMWVYLILFVIVFCETGLVVTPLLPGDSLLFAAGTFASPDKITGETPLELSILFPVLLIAVFLGDNTNYFIGRKLGPTVFDGKVKFLKKSYLDKTKAFYEKHGGKTIILARFVPIVRTFAPFVAGVGAMTYRKFLSFSIIGSILWITVGLLAGYYFGKLDFVQNNFSLIMLGIVVISVLPVVIGLISSKIGKKKTA